MNQARHTPLAIHGQNYRQIRRVHNLRRLRQIFIVALALLLTAGGITMIRKQAQAAALAALTARLFDPTLVISFGTAGG